MANCKILNIIRMKGQNVQLTLLWGNGWTDPEDLGMRSKAWMYYAFSVDWILHIAPGVPAPAKKVCCKKVLLPWMGKGKLLRGPCLSMYLQIRWAKCWGGGVSMLSPHDHLPKNHDVILKLSLLWNACCQRMRCDTLSFASWSYRGVKKNRITK